MKADPKCCVALVQIDDEFASAQIHQALQAAYRMEADLIGCSDFPPLRETVAEFWRTSDHVLVFRNSDAVVGVLTFARDGNSVAITRLGVSPAHVRNGIASALLADLERRHPSGTTLTVSTAEINAPAVCLYQRLGYVTTGTSTTPEGIALVHLSKCAAA